MTDMTQQQQKTTDALGRATFFSIAPIGNVRPTERELGWFKHIKCHGPQSSSYLYELTRDTHRCKDTSLRQLQKLRASGYLRLPSQQRATKNPGFNPYIYDLTQKAHDCLNDLDLAEPTVRPTGHWLHGYAVSCATSAIDISAKRQNIRYIAAHKILAIKNATLAIPLDNTKLIPDQLFALDYDGSYRAFALEMDRGTEPETSATARKNYARSICQYANVIENGLHRTHYGIRSPLLVLWVFTNRTNQRRFLDLCGKYSDYVKQSISTAAPFDLNDSPIKPDLLANWERVSGGNLNLFL